MLYVVQLIAYIRKHTDRSHQMPKTTPPRVLLRALGVHALAKFDGLQHQTTEQRPGEYTKVQLVFGYVVGH